MDQLFAGSQVPPFERNERTIELLYQLMMKNSVRDREMQYTIEDLRQKAVEYTADGQRLGNILAALNLKSGSLSQSGVMSLRTLANLSYLLQVRDACDTSYLLALRRLHEEGDEVRESLIAEKRLLGQLTLKTKDALVKHSSLLKTCQELEQTAGEQSAEMESRAKSAGFLHSKARDYTQLISKLKGDLSKTGVDPSTFHENLVKKSQELQNLQEELEPLKRKLKNYHDLPPDISQAKVKIAELTQKVASLEAELSKKIDSMRL